MDDFITRLGSQLGSLSRKLIQVFQNAAKQAPLATTDDTLRKLQASAGELVKQFSPQYVDEELISEGMINKKVLPLIYDLFMLSGNAMEVGTLSDRQKRSIAEKVNSIRSTVRSQTSKISELNFLQANRDYLNAFSQDFYKNYALPDEAAFMNAVTNELSLKPQSAKRSDKPKISVDFLGTPQVITNPKYSLENLVDNDLFSAWYSVQAYRSSPYFWIDGQTDSIIAHQRGKLLISGGYSPATSTRLKVDTSAFTRGEWICLELPTSSTHEKLFIEEIDEATSELVVRRPNSKEDPKAQAGTGTIYPHIMGAPIYKGKDIQFVSGSVAVITFEFPFPQEVNSLTLQPFMIAPLEVIGLYYKVERKDQPPWKLIEETALGTRIRELTHITFDRVIADKFKLIVCSPNGETSSFRYSSKDNLESLIWDRIYTAEVGDSVNEFERLSALFSKDEVHRARNKNFEGFFNRKPVVDSAKVPGGNDTSAKLDGIIDKLNAFVGNTTELDRVATRMVFSMGLAEVGLDYTLFTPFSMYEGKATSPSQISNIVKIEAEEYCPPLTTVNHYVELENRERVPVVNSLNMDAYGMPVSRNEALEPDFTTRKCNLKFKPFENFIDIEIYKEGSDPVIIRELVGLDNTVIIPPAQFSTKYVYQSTYSVEDSAIHIASNLASIKNTEKFTDTDKDGFIVLAEDPVVAPEVINFPAKWRKVLPFDARWTLNETVAGYSDSTSMFHSSGIVIDNVYYGPKCINPVARTTGGGLEPFLRNMFGQYSGDVTLKVNRFFNKYAGSILEANLTYAPITVRVDDQPAINLTNYEEPTDNGAVVDYPLHLQYTHYSNKIKFHKAPPSGSVITVEYRFKATTIKYVAELASNKKSNFYTTPKLKNVVVATGQ